MCKLSGSVQNTESIHKNSQKPREGVLRTRRLCRETWELKKNSLQITFHESKLTNADVSYILKIIQDQEDPQGKCNSLITG